MRSDFGSFLTRWRVPLGFTFGVAYLVLSQPTVGLLAAGSLTALVGIVIRACAAGYLDKNRALTTAGPYAYTRNPLYLGSLFIGLGLVMAGGRWSLALVFIVLFGLVYGTVMRCEAAGLRKQFGEKYEAYAASVPLFFPYRKPPRPQSHRFQWQRYRKNREYEAMLGYVAGVLFLTLKILLR